MKILGIRITKDIKTIAYTILILGVFLFCWEIYFPKRFIHQEGIKYVAQKGMGDEEIAAELKELGIIKNSYAFRFYVIISFSHGKIQAGKYDLSPNMTIAEIVGKLAKGDVIKETILVPEGYDISDIKKYFVGKEICTEEEFEQVMSKDYSNDFPFLKERPKGINLEGYLFPDTYVVSLESSAEDIIRYMLSNFDKKINAGLREEILSQKKTVFEVITMASIIEKEVRSFKDKKIVSGILWKRLEVGMPLQVDSSVNYITGKNDPGAAIKDTKIDSPYNTYKYNGLPFGPISNPGLDSILAAIYPEKTSYWYYRNDSTGKTIFSKTFADHNGN